MNIVNLVGRVARDSEVLTFGKGKDKNFVLSFTVVCNKKYKDSEGETQEKVTFIPCQMWGERANKLEEYVTKGTLISVTGELDLRSEENKDYEGVYNNYTNVIVSRLELLSSNSDKEDKKKNEKKRK